MSIAELAISIEEGKILSTSSAHGHELIYLIRSGEYAIAKDRIKTYINNGYNMFTYELLLSQYKEQNAK